MTNDGLGRVADVLRAVAPHLSPAAVTTWTRALTVWMRSEGITSPRRVAMFCGQVAEESGGYSVLVENLHYTTVARLRAVWPARFPSDAAAAPYVNNPEGLADLVYAGRLGNGDAASGDGFRFCGHGLIELTGRALDTRFAVAFGKTLDDAVAWMLTPSGAAASACWYWTLPDHPRSLNALSDTWDIAGVTRIINGGETNLRRRVDLVTAALAVFDPVPGAAPASETTADDLNVAQLAKMGATA